MFVHTLFHTLSTYMTLSIHRWILANSKYTAIVPD